MSENPASLAKFSTVIHTSYEPDDYDAALEHWTQKMGASPYFHTQNVEVKNVKYHGAVR